MSSSVWTLLRRRSNAIALLVRCLTRQILETFFRANELCLRGALRFDQISGPRRPNDAGSARNQLMRAIIQPEESASKRKAPTFVIDCPSTTAHAL